MIHQIPEIHRRARPYYKPVFRRIFTLERIVIFTLVTVNILLLYTFNKRTAGQTAQLEALRSKLAIVEKRQQLPLFELQEEISFSLPALDSVFTGIVFENRITISGHGAENCVLALYVDNRLQSARASRDGRFQFNDVKLIPGLNKIILKALAPDNTVLPVGEISVEYRSAAIDALSADIQRGSSSLPAVALTFDAGSNNNNAAQILDILREKKVRCTIFLTGKFIEKYPDIARRIVAEGHEVGNHTYSHLHLTNFEQNSRHETLPEISYESFQRELVLTDSLFKAVTGSGIKKFWRAPFGEHNLELRRWAAEMEYRHISWTQGHDPGESMDTHDWVSDETSELYKSPQEIQDALLNFERNEPNKANGAIILMHLGSNRKEDFLYQALPGIIDGFRQQGYELCTISELLAEKGK
ncbi:hypothetical protein AMJ80_05870 [bacterium SM23_31]|nr:MAG: hypothetical protein AMJ80_05870 [bacterium SM23_31]